MIGNFLFLAATLRYKRNKCLSFFLVVIRNDDWFELLILSAIKSVRFVNALNVITPEALNSTLAGLGERLNSVLI